MALTESTSDEDIDKMFEMIDNIEERYKTNKLTNTREIYKNENNEIVTRAQK